MEQFSRAERLFGRAAMEKLAASRVALFGIGGVGGYVAEALVRSGLGALDFFDDDDVALSNLNRQIIATHDTLGMPKVEAMAARLRSINPAARLEGHALFYMPENADAVDLAPYDYVVDAVDTVAAKLELAVRCQALGVPIISAMGAGNKLDPTKLAVTDIYSTVACPLARVMRRELRKRGIERLKVVYSTEPARTPVGEAADPGAHSRRSVPGSTAFVPPAMGLIIAAEVVRDLVGALIPDEG